jgi:hypothetical protein
MEAVSDWRGDVNRRRRSVLQAATIDIGRVGGKRERACQRQAKEASVPFVHLLVPSMPEFDPVHSSHTSSIAAGQEPRASMGMPGISLREPAADALY